MKAPRAVLLCLLFAALPAFAAEVAGVKLDAQASVAGSEVALVGAGLRTRLFFQVYVIGLYVSNLKADPLAQPGPKRVQIHMLRDVDAATFTEALAEGIKANASEAEVRVLEPRVKQLSAIMAEVKEAKKGMRIALDWTGKHTQVLIDGKPAGAPIEGEDFYRALLRIWLGDKPVQDDLKKALLGAK
jgi:hypothetical protein